MKEDPTCMSIPNQLKQDIHSVYSRIFKTDFDMQKKKVLLTSLIGAYEWSWKVVGVSENALKSLAEKKYIYTPGIVRAHIVARIDTAKIVFDKNKECLNEGDFFDHILANDKTVLTIKKENTTRYDLPDVIPICTKEILFPCQHVGYKHAQGAAAYLRDLHQKFNEGKIVAVKALDLSK